MTGAPNRSARRMAQLRKLTADVRNGYALPTTKDLLQLAPFMGNDIHLDMRTFARVAIRRIRTETKGAADLKLAFQNLTLDGVGLKDVLSARRVLKKHGPAVLGKAPSALFAIRLEIYCGSMDHPPMVQLAWKRCLEAATVAHSNFDAFLYLQAGLGWYAVSQRTYRAKNDPGEIRAWGERALTAAFNAWTEMRAPAEPATKAAQTEATQAKAPPDAPGTLTVLHTVGNADLMVGKRIADEFSPILKVALPLTKAENLEEVRTTLIREFPWASAVVDVLFADLSSRSWIYHRPTILLGPPGCGKTRFSSRFYALLGVKSRVYNAGGVADASFMGAARHWSSAEPSLPLSLCRSTKVANPAVIIDEIDKASDSRHNGSMYDALLGMTEPESAVRWYDPYVQSSVNLTGILWLATANDAADIPDTLRDRFRILAFPEPTDDFLEPLSRILMKEIAEERGLHRGWASPLTRAELDALWKVWPGGSLRALRRYLETIMAAREADYANSAPN